MYGRTGTLRSGYVLRSLFIMVYDCVYAWYYITIQPLVFLEVALLRLGTFSEVGAEAN